MTYRILIFLLIVFSENVNAQEIPQSDKIFHFLNCNSCDIDEIKPEMPDTNTRYFSEELGTVDGCQRTRVTCERLDNLDCLINIFAINPTGTHFVTQRTEHHHNVSTVLTCENGAYKFGVYTGITKLICEYQACREPVFQISNATVPQPTTTAN
ncbi:unnamed protein product [Caenorhabditis nigoni]